MAEKIVEVVLTGRIDKGESVVHRKMTMKERLVNCLVGGKDKVVVIMDGKVVTIQDAGVNAPTII